MPSRRDALSTLSLAGLAFAGAGCLGGLGDSGTGNDETEDGGTGDEDSETMVAVWDGDEEIKAVTYDQVESAGEVREHEQGDGYFVPVEFDADGTESFTNALESAGAFESPEDCEMRLYFDGERVHTAALGSDLAEAVEDGRFDGEFLVLLDDRETAEQLQARIEG